MSRRTSGVTLTSSSQKVTPVNSAQASRRQSSTIGGHVRTKRKKKKSGKSKAEEELEAGIDILPVFVGLICAGTLATPVILLMGLKLGMFAAIGGGAMGYTTGKMFSDATNEDENMKSEFADVNDGKGEAGQKIRRRMRRIAEWQKFEENCLRAKAFLEECQQAELERAESERGRPRRRAQSLDGSGGRRPGDGGRRSMSLPSSGGCLLPEVRSEQVEAWRGGGVGRRLTLRASSLSALPEEAEEDVISLRSKRRSKSIDSSYNYEVEMAESRV